LPSGSVKNASDSMPSSLMTGPVKRTPRDESVLTASSIGALR
jgi:hypothetical protein